MRWGCFGSSAARFSPGPRAKGGRGVEIGDRPAFHVWTEKRINHARWHLSPLIKLWVKAIYGRDSSWDYYVG